MAEKLPECDREAARLLALQLKSSGTGRILDRVLAALFVGALFCTAALHILTPDREISETENRTLAGWPTFSWSALESGEYTEDVATYMADQFPGRDFFITLKAGCEALLGKGGNNGVWFGEGETLIARDDLPDTENLASNLASMDAFSAWCEEKGISSLAAITGRTADVLDDALPSYYGSYYSDRLWDTLTAQATGRSYDFLDLRTPLRTRARAGEYVYYRTDHHWTTLGAYYGYCEILSSLGVEPTALNEYERETVSDAFYGTTWSTAGASWISPDEMEYFRYADDEDYTVTIVDDGTTFASFYDESYLAGKDKYSSFLSGNHALVTVTKNTGEDRPVMLVIKDSFAHAAAPFLARHYDLVIVDMRYYKQRVTDLVEEYGVHQVLYLMNVDSLTGSTVLRMLEAGT